MSLFAVGSNCLSALRQVPAGPQALGRYAAYFRPKSPHLDQSLSRMLSTLNLSANHSRPLCRSISTSSNQNTERSLVTKILHNPTNSILLNTAKHFLDSQPIRNASLYQMHHMGPPKKPLKRLHPLEGNPQLKGLVLKTLIKKPRKPNSANLPACRLHTSGSVRREPPLAGKEFPVDGVFDEKLLDILCCPLSKAPLRYDKENQELICDELKVAYPIVNGIPNMIPTDARKLDE